MGVNLDIRDNCSNGKYDIDDNLYPRSYKDVIQINICRDEEIRVKKLFKQDCKKEIERVLYKEITDAQFVVIFDKAWEKGHANGLLEVIYELEDLLEITIAFI